MAHVDDVSAKHFDWVVKQRSRNQRSALELYRIIHNKRNDNILRHNTILQSQDEGLAAVVFSLWRAVFLSDLPARSADTFVDVKKFLQALIAHNAILYQTDFATRHWSFDYYLDNARYRLDELYKLYYAGADKSFHLRAKTAKDDWKNAQYRLEEYIQKFKMNVKAEKVRRQ